MIDFETEYIFCKDNRLVLIVQRLALLMLELKFLKLRPLYREHQLICIKASYSKSTHFGSYPKSDNFNKL